MMEFSHPLARDAKVWPAALDGDQPRNLLVVVTTLELKPESRRFKQDKVERLSRAAQEWLSFHQNQAQGFVLINRPKDWNAEN